MQRKIQILIFIAAGFVCYFIILDTAFLSDDYCWLAVYNNALPVLIKSNFNDLYFLPFTHLADFFMLWFFGYNVVGYHVFSLLFHTANSFLVVLLLEKIYAFYKLKSNNRYLFLIAGMIFLVIPYQTEAVVWYSAKSYVLATFFILIALIAYLDYKEKGKTKFIVISMMAFIMSLFSKEIAIIFPLIIVVAELTILPENNKKGIWAVIAFFLILALYFVTRYLILGSLVGSYNAGMHLTYTLSLVSYHYLMYFAKFFSLFRYLPVQNKIVYFIILLTSIALIAILVKKLRNDNHLKMKKFRLLLFLFLTFVITLLPVVNLEITSLSQVQSDRYGYLASLPAVLIMTVFIDFISENTLFKNTIYVVVLIAFSFLTIKTNKLWYEAGHKSEVILNSIFKNNHVDNRDVYFLNVPDNYRGIYLFRNGLKEAITIKRNDSKWAIRILSYQVCNTSEISIIQNNEPGKYCLTLLKGDKFIKIDTTIFSDQNFIKIIGFDSTHITLKTSSLDTGSSEKLILYYDNESMQPIR